jgi:cell fate (sporulation/competence/biofilm development) regulator YlbF (YheA/YmcA/DUF963 family)
MKHEFDALVGIDTDPECYKKIEAVYMQFDYMFPTKEAIASFYKKHDMNGIERMYKEALKIQDMEKQLKANSQMVVLTNQSTDFTELINILKKRGFHPIQGVAESMNKPVELVQGNHTQGENTCS